MSSEDDGDDVRFLARGRQRASRDPTMNLRWTLPHTEAAAWLEAPASIRRVFDRSDLLAQLDARRDRFLDEVARELEPVLPATSYEVVRAGDWHAGRCTLVLRSAALGVAVKVREPASDRVVAPFLDLLGEQLGSRLHIPASRRIGRLWLQDYVAEQPGVKGSPTDLGALLALSLWLGLTDLHAENLLPSRRGIELVDLECAFLTHRGLTPRRRLWHTGILSASGMPWDGGRRFERDHRHGVLEVFRLALELLHRAGPGGLYHEVDRVAVRRLVSGTELYRRFLRRRFLLAWTDRRARQEWARWSEARPRAQPIHDHEVRALLRWDVPCFVQRGAELGTASDGALCRSTPPSHGLRRLHRHLASPDRRRELATRLEELLARRERAEEGRIGTDQVAAATDPR